jgi:hypothetical protein
MRISRWIGFVLPVIAISQLVIANDEAPPSVLSSSLVQAPYPGPNAHAVPGSIEAENFDSGGELESYHDTTSTNQGGQYRTGEGVDVEATGVGNYMVAYVKAGEWLEYTIDVSTAGTYTFTARVSTPAATGGTFHVEVDGVAVSGALTVPNTGNWQTFADVITSDIALTTGTHVVRIAIDSNGSNSYMGNIDRFSLTVANAQTPYPGPSPHPIPGAIQAENFDEGGEAVAYHDTTLANQGNVATRTTAVDIQHANGVTWVSHLKAGEWMEYTATVAGGYYTFYAKVASNGTGGVFHVEMDGIDQSDPQTVPNTGNWQTFSTLTRNMVYMEPGTHVFRLVVDSVGSTGFLGNVDEFGFTAER